MGWHADGLLPYFHIAACEIVAGDTTSELLIGLVYGGLGLASLPLLVHVREVVLGFGRCLVMFVVAAVVAAVVCTRVVRARRICVPFLSVARG